MLYFDFFNYIFGSDFHIPINYNEYYNILSQGNFIITSTVVNYDLFTFLIDCFSRWHQKSESDFLVPA